MAFAYIATWGALPREMPDRTLEGQVRGLLTDLRRAKSEHDDLADEGVLERRFSGTLRKLEKLSRILPDMQRKLKRLWSISAKFKEGRAHCRNRHFSRQWRHLEQYLYIILDFESFDTSLKPDGLMEEALHQAQQLLATSCVWPSRGVKLNDFTLYSQHSNDSFLSEYWQVQDLLRRLSAYERLLELDHQTIKSQLRQLRSVEDALDEEDRQKKEEQSQREISMRRLARSIRQVAIRLQVNLQFLLLLCKSSKFPDGDEPACMTMPWNILPALIVLWGVCWMFYGSFGFSDPTAVQYPIGAGNDETLGRGEWNQWPNYELLPEAEADIPLAGLNTFAGQLMFPDADSVPSHFTAFPEYQAENAVDLAHFGCQHAQEADGIPFDVSGHHSPAPTRAPAQLSSHHTSSPIFEQILPSRTTSGQPASRSSDDSILCPHTECNGLQFDQISEWKKHNERKHDRHKCLVQGCDQSFGSKGELLRHGHTKHNQLPSDKRFRCPFTGCRYSLIPHFKRKDHLTNHLKCMHACSPAEAKARADAQVRGQPRSAIDHLAEPQPSSTSQLQLATAAITTATNASSDSSSDRPDSATPIPPKRRRLAGRDPVTADASTATQITASHDGIETWKRKAAEHEQEVGVVKTQNAALRTENESLKSEIERLKRCEESLIAAVLAATRKP